MNSAPMDPQYTFSKREIISLSGKAFSCKENLSNKKINLIEYVNKIEENV